VGVEYLYLLCMPCTVPTPDCICQIDFLRAISHRRHPQALLRDHISVPHDWEGFHLGVDRVVGV
jgi:hypothetical protein